jgi:hypothetical protein
MGQDAPPAGPGFSRARCARFSMSAKLRAILSSSFASLSTSLPITVPERSTSVQCYSNTRREVHRSFGETRRERGGNDVPLRTPRPHLTLRNIPLRLLQPSPQRRQFRLLIPLLPLEQLPQRRQLISLFLSGCCCGGKLCFGFVEPAEELN